MPDAFPVIAVHGGAGTLGPDDPASSGGPDAPRLAGVRRAAATGLALLGAGARALDAVEAAVRILEDDPTYNAGTGACLTSAGEAELDAAIMDGATLRCGAVGVLKDVRNPVSLARLVMERTGYVLLAGPGASAFARQVGVEAWDNARLVTVAQRARWAAARAGAAAHPFGTVGAVARDGRGHLAAATSTGGTAMKHPGRMGDTPVIGAGTYADDELAAVSCTGHGERFIELGMARLAADLVGRGLGAAAAQAALRRLEERVHGSGGLILVGPSGEVGFAYNTPVMARAWSSPEGEIRAAL
jgi:beta-aspartyl-peptidase (threonine type)